MKKYGSGMKFFATKENYDEVLEKVSLLYPLATVEIKEIKLPELTEKEKALLGINTISYSENRDNKFEEQSLKNILAA